MKPDCEYCGASLPEGVDKNTRRTRSAHFAQHTAERQKEESGVHFTAHNTVDKQPEALRLAETLSGFAPDSYYLDAAADELRRLHALCEELGEALEATQDQIAAGPKGHAVFQNNVVVLRKWKESK